MICLVGAPNSTAGRLLLPALLLAILDAQAATSRQPDPGIEIEL
jgi:hypothetical protein